ncbi:heterotrimeric G-protein alpha subunit, GPA1-like protein [Gymnopilus junonius]|uniref:Heterotrimeric G-protein alpha subunit, GPA1-like protein n=1 Tax=Gymnopilus junonius TaxID=109634 RepID=A0A9P5NJ80_GYMJU|nr:heterotrimeric G-protein alpha subunit, GPA1-like protein [Gymnopilus junonius]
MFKVMGRKGPSRAEKEAKARNEEIDRQLMTEALKPKNELKMLFLESGNSGGLELLRQFKLIQQGGYSTSEREAYKDTIYSNAIQAMKFILEAIPELGLTLAPSNNTSSATILSLPSQVEYSVLPHNIAEALRSLWGDLAVQQAVRRSNEFNLNESAVYYFRIMDRLWSPRYIPTDQDIMRCKIRTTGISETNFMVGDTTYKIFHLGGQRGERRKWVHQFDNVTAVMYMVNLAEYDEMLEEDNSVNRLEETFLHFDSVCNSKWFSQTPFILILNHVDRFAAKLHHSPLGDYFPDYRGGNDYDAACDYILNRFVSLNQNTAKRQIYAHYCSNDPQQLKFILSAILDILLQLYLRDKRLL